MTKHTAPAAWTTLLEQALTEPGKLAKCYRAFHNYSFGNQLLAMFQCEARGIAIGPMATYKGWQGKGRCVQKGQKAVVLCVPIMGSKEDEETGKKVQFLVGFTYKARWFVVAQTDGDDATLDEVPGWDWNQACSTLGITRIPFEYADGNSQGYSKGNGQVAVSPVAQHASRTMLHEMAHALLHPKDSSLDKATKELEAEAVAYLISATLELPGLTESRGYMQHWYGKGNTVDERTANRIFGAANKILDAGKEVE